MMELIIGGKIAPIPSLLRKCSTIHSSQAFNAFSRFGDHLRFSTSFKVESVTLKNRFQKLRFNSFAGFAPSTINSLMLARSGTRQYGRCAHRTASGTTMPRVHADISERLTGDQRGSRMISGGTAGQRSHGYCPKIA